MAYRDDMGVLAQPDTRGRSQRMLRAGLSSRRFGQRGMMVRNVSTGGLGGTTDQLLKVGERVIATLPNLGEVEGRVVWTAGSWFGLNFDDEIDPDRVTRSGFDRNATPFVVMERYRPEASSRRPPIGLR